MSHALLPCNSVQQMTTFGCYRPLRATLGRGPVEVKHQQWRNRSHQSPPKAVTHQESSEPVPLLGPVSAQQMRPGGYYTGKLSILPRYFFQGLGYRRIMVNESSEVIRETQELPHLCYAGWSRPLCYSL